MSNSILLADFGAGDMILYDGRLTVLVHVSLSLCFNVFNYNFFESPKNIRH